MNTLLASFSFLLQPSSKLFSLVDAFIRIQKSHRSIVLLLRVSRLVTIDHISSIWPVIRQVRDASRHGEGP